MNYRELVNSGVKFVILEHGNNSVRRETKVATDKELSQYKFDKVIGTTAYFKRDFKSPYIQ